MDKRPAFQAMFERIRLQRDVRYVIVYKLSRMNRNRADDALVLVSLRKYHATLISATESIDETPVGQLMHGILASFNEYRSAEDGADIRYKMGEKAKKGGTLGRAPLGYLNHRDRFEGREVRMVVLDPERAPFVKLAFELYDTGRFTLQGLADELYDRGLRSRPGRFPAGAVTDSKLCTLLRDRYYLGVVTYKGAEYPGRHEPLVDQELFDRVQLRIESTGLSGERRITHDQYLKGTVWCARCHESGVKRRLIVNRVAGKGDVEYFYYFCRGRQDTSCTLPYIAIYVLEEEIARFWGTQGLSETFIQQVSERMKTTLDEDQASAQLLRHQISTELAAVDRQEENLLDLAAGGTLAMDKIQTRLTRLAAERKRLTGRLSEGGEQLREGALVLARQLELLFHPEALYRQLDDLGRRLLNQAVFEELLIDVDEAEPRVVGVTYTEPVRGLMQAHEDHRSGSPVSSQVRYDRRPTVSGGPSERTLTDLLRVPHVEVWSKAVMVELRRFELLTPSMPWRCATSCATAPPLRSRPRVRPPCEARRVYPSTGGGLQIGSPSARRSTSGDQGNRRPQVTL